MGIYRIRGIAELTRMHQSQRDAPVQHAEVVVGPIGSDGANSTSNGTRNQRLNGVVVGVLLLVSGQNGRRNGLRRKRVRKSGLVVLQVLADRSHPHRDRRRVVAVAVEHLARVHVHNQVLWNLIHRYLGLMRAQV